MGEKANRRAQVEAMVRDMVAAGSVPAYAKKVAIAAAKKKDRKESK
tara:strand:+ start:607 stop:744 length:138 start_codon:yes stop_codon:yes gene_type:complete